MNPTKEEMEEAVKAAGWEFDEDYHMYTFDDGLALFGKFEELYELDEAYDHEITQNKLKEQTE